MSNSDQGGGPQDLFLDSRGLVDSPCSDEGSLEGNFDFCYALLIFLMNYMIFQGEKTLIELLLIKPFHCSAGTSVHWLGMMKAKMELRSLQCSARSLLSLVVSLVSFFRCVYSPFLRKQSNVHPSAVIETNMVISNPPAALEAVSEDHVRPCLERLQRLERILAELSNKSASIPVEKEKMLLDSLDRIKSVEHDLGKTKRVSSRSLMDDQEFGVGGGKFLIF